jgi:hypothetical protein
MWGVMLFAARGSAYTAGAGHDFAGQNRCSLMHPGLEGRKARPQGRSDSETAKKCAKPTNMTEKK